MAEKKKSKLVVVLIIALVVVVAAAGIVIWKLLGSKSDGEGSQNSSGKGIGYEMNAQLLTSGDVAVSQGEGIGVSFSPIARSNDGINFTCEIANSTANALDMYIDIYLDFESEEELYLSGLLRPGEGITSFKTNRQMPNGTYDVIMVPTLVEDDHATLHSQTYLLLTFVVE